jgi:GNAT superfamily N-acetyltransferase
MTPAVRFAATDDDVIAIHRFLCVAAQPVLLDEIDALKSVTEINRIVHDRKYGFALIAEINGELVGSLGVICPTWWYGRGRFFTDRFFFVFPALTNAGIGAALIAEAAAVATAAGLDLIINGKFVRRNRSAGRGVVFTSPKLIRPGDSDAGTEH